MGRETIPFFSPSSIMWKKIHVFIKIIGWNATYNKRNEISWLIVFLLEFMHKSHAHVFTHMYVSSIIWYVSKSFLFFSFLNDYLLSQCKTDKQIAHKQLPKAKKNEQNTKHKTQNTCIKWYHTQWHQNIIKKKLLISNWAKCDQLRVPGRMGNITSMTPSWTSTSQTHRILQIGTNPLTHRKLYYIEWSEFIEIRGQARKPYPL